MAKVLATSVASRGKTLDTSLIDRYEWGADMVETFREEFIDAGGMIC